MMSSQWKEVMQHRVLVLLALLGLCLPKEASAEVEFQGDWPDEAAISLQVDGEPCAAATLRLAEAAGWDLLARDLGKDPVFIRVNEEAPRKVLAQLLSDGDYVVERDGDLVSIRRAVASAEPAAAGAEGEMASTAAESAVTENEDGDRVITSDTRIARGEFVRDVFAWGSDVVVEGTVTGEMFVVGGSAKFTETAYVAGDVFALGGDIEIHNGARIKGEVGALGGSLHRGDQVDVKCTTCDSPEEPADPTGEFLSQVLRSLSSMALMWVIGAALLSIASRRVGIVRDQIVARPLRCFALGLAALVFVVGLIVTLAVTLVGIPLALLGAFLVALCAYLSFGVVLLAMGARLARRWTGNPYAQLGVGCFFFFLLSLVPFAGGIASFLVPVLGLGGLVATRGAGGIGADG